MSYRLPIYATTSVSAAEALMIHDLFYVIASAEDLRSRRRSNRFYSTTHGL